MLKLQQCISFYERHVITPNSNLYTILWLEKIKLILEKLSQESYNLIDTSLYIIYLGVLWEKGLNYKISSIL